MFTIYNVELHLLYSKNRLPILLNFLISAIQVKSDIGDVDILINNAGIVTGKKLLECSDTLIEKTFAVNTVAHFWV